MAKEGLSGGDPVGVDRHPAPSTTTPSRRISFIGPSISAGHRGCNESTGLNRCAQHARTAGKDLEIRRKVTAGVAVELHRDPVG